MEEASWRKKSRELLLKEGDKNTGFFHIITNSHRRRNSILNITINGRRLDQESEIKEGSIEAFQSLFSSPNNWHLPLLDLLFNVISEKQADKLEEIFTKEEILASISRLKSIWVSLGFLVFQLRLYER